MFRFGIFELDPDSGELRKRGLRVKLHAQAFRVLTVLLQKAGQEVTRDELRRELWPPSTYVDFDHALATAVNKIRQVLGDSHDSPRFIETLPRRGYRFISPVETAGGLEPHPSAPEDRVVSIGSPETSRGSRAWSPAVRVAALSVLLSSIALIGYQKFSHSTTAQPLPQSGDRDRLPAGASPRRIMLAVLPFEDLSGTPEREYASDGLTEELITRLALNGDELGVIARTSAMTYKKTNKRADQIGRELGVGYIVEGTLRWVGERVRVSVQLIRARDQTPVWAQTYDRSIADLLALETEIAEEIARGIRVRLVPATRPSVSAGAGSAAYLAWLQGRYFWNKRSQAGLRRSIEFLEEAIRDDPNYANAYAALANSYLSLALIGGSEPRKAFELATEAATRALQLDARMSDAHASLADLELYKNWDWASAEREFRKAIELNPGNSTAHQWYGEYLRLMGRQQEAIQQSTEALQLDPVSPIINTEAGLPYYFLGEYEKALAYFRKALELDPTFALAHCHLGWSYEEQGKYEDAIAELETAARLDDTPMYLVFLGHAYGSAGRKQEAQRIIQKLKSMARSRFVAPTYLAIVYAGMSDRQREVEWLEKAYDERFWGLAWLKVQRKFGNLSDNDRFSVLLRKMNFP